MDEEKEWTILQCFISHIETTVFEPAGPSKKPSAQKSKVKKPRAKLTQSQQPQSQQPPEGQPPAPKRIKLVCKKCSKVYNTKAWHQKHVDKCQVEKN